MRTLWPARRTAPIFPALSLFVLCTFAMFGAACSSIMQPRPPTATPSMSPIDVVHRNMEAMNAEDIAAFMATLHPNAIDRAETEAMLIQIFELYDLSTTLTDVRITSETADEVQVYALVTVRKLRGPELNNVRLDSVFVLRKHGSEWKLLNENVLQLETPRQ